MTKPKRVRVMIVEDSAVVRQLLTHIVASDDRFEVVSAVASAEEALAVIGRAKPDVVSMDIRLPGMDGLEATRRIMTEHPTPIVVIADAVEDTASRFSMNALRAGALSVVEKPVGISNAGYEALAETIRTQLFIMSSVPVIRRRSFATRKPEATGAGESSRPLHGFQGVGFVGLAASTGGPPALAKVLETLSADFPAPILIVQHMGEPFMEGFARWLNGVAPIKVAVAVDGEPAQPGAAYVAPGDRHLQLAPSGVLRIAHDPPVGGQRPSANVLFRSMAEAAGPRCVGVLLTGMGDDGAVGLRELHDRGGHTIAEHPSTTVVNGMPGAAVALKAAQEVLPLDAIGRRLQELASPGGPS